MMTLSKNLLTNLRPDVIDTFLLRGGVSLITIISLWLTHNLIVSFAKRHLKNHDTIYATRKISRYLHFIISAFIIAQLWFKGIQSFGTFLGLFTAGVAIALKDVVTNFAGWIYLLWQAPFKIGDRIQIQDHQGDVIDIGVFKFTLLEIGNWVDANQSTGRMIRIPNADIFNQPIANYSKGFNYIWYEIPVVVTYESDWKKTKALLNDLISEYCKQYEDQLKRELRHAQKDYPINYTYITPTIYTSTLDHGIRLTIRYLVATRRIRQSNHELWEKILDITAQHDDIDLAYPTIRHLTQTSKV
jgi:small-conductance mechanosensitive channel